MIKEWIINVVSIVLIFTIISSIFPKKSSFNLIKTIIVIVVIATILDPVLNLKNSDFKFDFDSFWTQECLSYDSEVLVKLKVDRYKNICKTVLDNYGINGAEVLIEYCIKSNEVLINKININLSKSVIKNNDEHIDIIVDVKDDLSVALNIDKDLVVFYG